MIRGKSNNISSSMIVILYAFLIAALLIAMLCAGRLFRNFVESDHINENKRATISYIESKVISLDSKDFISVNEGKYSQVLILKESMSDYETRIFLYDDKLLEEFAKSGSDIDLGNCYEISDASSLDFYLDKEYNLLKIEIDDEGGYVHIRSKVV